MSVGLFEVLAADETDTRLANRKALVLAETRVDAALGRFLTAAKTPQEFDARFDLVKDDFEGIVTSACKEIGTSPDSIQRTLHAHFRNASYTKEAPGKQHLPGASDKRNRQYEHIKEDYLSDGKSEDEAEELAARTVNKERSRKHETKESRVAGEQHWIQDAVKKPGDLHKKLDVPEDEKIPESKIQKAKNSDSENLKEKAQFAENVKKSSLAILSEDIQKLARQPKMCPYHKEVVDIALATSNPQAGYETMQQHAWSDHHCQGSWDGGKCKFKREMVTQSFWDDRQKQLDEKREQRAELGQQNVLDLPTEDTFGDTDTNDSIDLEDSEVVDFPSEGGDAPVSEPVSEAPLAIAESKTSREHEDFWDDDDQGPLDSSEHDSERDHYITDLQRSESEPDDDDDDDDRRKSKVAAEGDEGDSYTKDKLDLSPKDSDKVTGLGDPEPKIDKGTDRKPGETGWDSRDVDVPSKANPTERIDPVAPIEKKDITDSVKSDVKGIGEQTTDSVDLPTAQIDGSGFAENNQKMAPGTDTWHGEGQQKAVTQAVSNLRWSHIEKASWGEGDQYAAEMADEGHHIPVGWGGDPNADSLAMSGTPEDYAREAYRNGDVEGAIRTLEQEGYARGQAYEMLQGAQHGKGGSPMEIPPHVQRGHSGEVPF